MTAQAHVIEAQDRVSVRTRTWRKRLKTRARSNLVAVARIRLPGLIIRVAKRLACKWRSRWISKTAVVEAKLVSRCSTKMPLLP